MPISRSTSSVSAPSAGAAPVVSAGVRDSLIGAPTCFTGPMPGWSSSTTIPRARTSSESSTSSRSRIGSRQQSCSPANAVHSSRVRSRNTAAISAPASESGMLELLLDQVGPADPVAPVLPELRLERAQRDPVAVLRLVREVAGDPARELGLAAPRHPLLGEVARRPPSRATTARRRSSRCRPAGPRPSARARAAPPGCRPPPSARRRRGRRSGRRTGSAGRRGGRSARAGR